MIQGKRTAPLGGTSETRASKDRSSSDPRPETTTSSPGSAGGSGGGVRLTARGTPVREPGRFRCHGPRGLCITTCGASLAPFPPAGGSPVLQRAGRPFPGPSACSPCRKHTEKVHWPRPVSASRAPLEETPAAWCQAVGALSRRRSQSERGHLAPAQASPGLLRAAQAAAPALTRGPPAHAPSQTVGGWLPPWPAAPRGQCRHCERPLWMGQARRGHV